MNSENQARKISGEDKFLEVDTQTPPEFLSPNVAKIFIIAFATFPLLVPDLSIVRPADFLTGLIILLVIVGFKFNYYVNISIPLITLGFFIFTMIIIISIIHQLYTSTVIIRDLFEAVRPIRFIIISIAVSIVVRGQENRDMFLQYFIWATAVCAIFGLFQLAYLAMFGAETAIIAPLYTPAIHIRGAADGLRAIGTGANPNVFAMLLIPGLIASLLILMNRKTVDRNTVIGSVITIPVAITGIFASQSRTAFIALIVGITCAVLLYYPINTILFAKLAAAIAGCSVGVFALSAAGILDPRYLDILHLTQDSSLQARFDRWERLLVGIDPWSITGIIGHGPSESFLTEFVAVDSEYVELYFRYGALGMLWYLILFSGLGYTVAKEVPNHQGITRIHLVVVASFIFSCLIYGITAEFYQHLQLSTLLAILFGSVLYECEMT